MTGGSLSPPDGQHYHDSTPVSPSSSAAQESRHEVQSVLDGLLSEDERANYGHSPTSTYTRRPGGDTGMSPMASPTRGRRASAAGRNVPSPVEVGFNPTTPNTTLFPGNRYSETQGRLYTRSQFYYDTKSILVIQQVPCPPGGNLNAESISRFFAPHLHRDMHRVQCTLHQFRIKFVVTNPLLSVQHVPSTLSL